MVEQAITARKTGDGLAAARVLDLYHVIRKEMYSSRGFKTD